MLSQKCEKPENKHGPYLNKKDWEKVAQKILLSWFTAQLNQRRTQKIKTKIGTNNWNSWQKSYDLGDSAPDDFIQLPAK